MLGTWGCPRPYGPLCLKKVFASSGRVGRSAIDEVTGSGVVRVATLNYVVVRCGDHGPTLDVPYCERAFDEPVEGVWASDHFGVVADLAVPPSDPATTS
jgi:hypothetical protein